MTRSHLPLALLIACNSPMLADAPDANLSDTFTADAGMDAGAPPFQTLRSEPHRCESECDDWPTGGDLLRFDVEETFEDTVHERTFYVFVPENLGAHAPVWIHLHGGAGSAQRMIETFSGYPIVRGEPLFWQRNTNECQFDPYRRPTGFVDSEGEPCTPETVAAESVEPVLLVFPEGIVEADSSGRHWEDGRIPSPGFGTDEELRDDVGFLDHVVETLLAEVEAFSVDPERMYLSGTSNGGMMVQRILCEMGPHVPALQRVAAVASLVAVLPEALSTGVGRPRCEPNANADMSVLYVAGRGFPTPDESVDGDAFVPWGERGGVFENVSTDGGRVLGVEDSYSMLRSHIRAATGDAGREETTDVGLFTFERRHEAGDLSLVFLGVDGGHHLLGGTRFDFAPMLRTWSFLSRWHRQDERVLERPSLIEGES